MRILVTGISGFIGSAFASLALERGHEVAGLVRPASNLPSKIGNASKLTVLPGTLQDVPWKEVEKFRPDVTVHGAWLTKPGVYLESPENQELVEASVQFARKLRTLGSCHLVVLGTCFEYKPIPGPLKEDSSPIEPATV